MCIQDNVYGRIQIENWISLPLHPMNTDVSQILGRSQKSNQPYTRMVLYVERNVSLTASYTDAIINTVLEAKYIINHKISVCVNATFGIIVYLSLISGGFWIDQLDVSNSVIHCTSTYSINSCLRPTCIPSTN